MPIKKLLPYGSHIKIINLYSGYIYIGYTDTFLLFQQYCNGKNLSVYSNSKYRNNHIFLIIHQLDFIIYINSPEDLKFPANSC